MDTNTVITVLCSGAFLAFLQFLITFFITRKDTKEKEAKEEKKAEEEEFKNGRFTEFEKKIQGELEEYEKMKDAGYEKHEKAFENMSKQHREDFHRLFDAIEQLKENDEAMAKSLDDLMVIQYIVGDGIKGLAHDKIMYLTQHILMRGCITVKEKATLDSIYEPYGKLNGNGQCKQAYECVMKLPVVTDEKALKLDTQNRQKELMNYLEKKH